MVHLVVSAVSARGVAPRTGTAAASASSVVVGSEPVAQQSEGQQVVTTGSKERGSRQEHEGQQVVVVVVATTPSVVSVVSGQEHQGEKIGKGRHLQQDLGVRCASVVFRLWFGVF